MYTRNNQAALGERPCLIKDEVRGAGQGFQCIFSPYYHTAGPQCAGRAGKGRRSRQRQRTGAADNKDGESNPKSLVWVQLAPDERCGCGYQQYGAHKPGCYSVCQAGEARLFGLGLLNRALQCREPAFQVAAQHANFQGCFGIYGTRVDGITGCYRAWQVLAVERVLAHGALTCDHLCIYRHGISCPDQQDITGLQLNSRNDNPLPFAACGNCIGQSFLCVKPGEIMTLPDATFKKATQQQEESEHHHGVEIHLSCTGDSGPDTGQPGEPDGQCNRQIHNQRALSQVAPGGDKKGSRGKKHHEAGHQQTHPAQQSLILAFNTLDVTGVQRHSKHAHLHHAEARYCQAAQFQPIFVAQLLPLGAGVIRPSPITQRIHLGEYLAEFDTAGLKTNIQPILLQVDQRHADTGQARHGLLYQPGAGGTGYAAQ